MKFYYPKKHYQSKDRGHLFPLLKPFLKAEGFTDKERIKIYDLSEKDFCFTEDIQYADIVILPMSWNYYTITKTTEIAIAVIEEAKQLKKEVWLFMADDYGMTFPKYEHCTIFRLNGNRSKLPKNHIGIPAFVNDPLNEIYNTTSLFKRIYTEKPTVGFCGLANNSTFLSVKILLKIIYRNFKFSFGISTIDKEQLISAPFLRNSCLKKIEKSLLITSNFLIRKQYRAGAITKQERQKTTIEFFDNIKNSDYVLCVRGAGNFSVRLYETLAMGRIPVFVNTDCIVPLNNSINWKQHMVWVEHNQLNQIEDKIIAFHNKLDNNKLNELFKSNRKLWEDKLKLKTFFNTINN